MKIKIKWNAFTNVSFKGDKIIEIDDEDWNYMPEEDRNKFLFDTAIEESGFQFDYEVME